MTETEVGRYEIVLKKDMRNVKQCRPGVDDIGDTGGRSKMLVMSVEHVLANLPSSSISSGDRSASPSSSAGYLNVRRRRAAARELTPLVSMANV